VSHLEVEVFAVLPGFTLELAVVHRVSLTTTVRELGGTDLDGHGGELFITAAGA